MEHLSMQRKNCTGLFTLQYTLEGFVGVVVMFLGDFGDLGFGELLG